MAQAPITTPKRSSIEIKNSETALVVANEIDATSEEQARKNLVTGQVADPETQVEEKLTDEEMDKELKELVGKYSIFNKQEGLKKEMKLSDVSEGPRHTKLQSFALIPTDIPRLLIIGETGAGKSSFCNKMAGIYYKYILPDDSDSSESSSSSEDDDVKNDPKNAKLNKNKKKAQQAKKEPQIICEGQQEIFKTGGSADSVTQTTSWAEVRFLGDTYKEAKPLIIIDTPGLNDLDNEKAKKHRLDLQAKLAAMQRVDLILFLLGKQAVGGGGGRFLNSTFQMISDIITVFGGNTTLYDHFAIGFSCCDEFDSNWRMGFEESSKKWQEKLQSEFGLNQRKFIFKNMQKKLKFRDNEKKDNNDEKEENDVKREIPMFELSNVQHKKRFGKAGSKRWSQHKEFKRLYNLCVGSQKDPLYSTDYVLMTKMRAAIERIQNTKGLTKAAAIQRFKREIKQQKSLLDLAYKENIEYLSSIPKNTLEGFASAGRVIGNSLLIGIGCLVVAPVAAGQIIWESDSSTASKAAQTIVLTPLALVGGALAGTLGIVGGLGLGVMNIFKGMRPGQNEETAKKAQALANEKKDQEDKIFEYALTGQGPFESVLQESLQQK